MRNISALRGHNRLCYFPFAETWLTVVTRRRRSFPQFELSFSLKVKYQFTFQSSLFIFLADNRQKHRIPLEKCSPSTQTYALMSRFLRSVIMSHRVSPGGIKSNCFRVRLQCCYEVLSSFIKLVMDLPSFPRSFDIRELKIETFSGQRQLQPNVTSSFVGYCACSWSSPCLGGPVGDVKLFCLALWRKREYLTVISIRFVAFSNQHFADYRS